jgi:predicted phosphodiesterase
MKLQIVSDLHNKWKYKPMGADALVIAGDIGNGKDFFYFKDLIKQITDIPVFFVLGNHDYYGHVQQEVPTIVKDLIKDAPNWHFLDNTLEIFDSVRFIGTPLWSDLGGHMNTWFVGQAIKNWPDFTYTKYIDKETGNIRRKNPHDLIPDWLEAVKFLRFAINEPFDGKTVVITHFVPTPQACHPRFGKSYENMYFNCDLEYLMGREMLWVFGHTHDPYDFMVGDTRLVCNPHGYNAGGERANNGYPFEDVVIEI